MALTRRSRPLRGSSHRLASAEPGSGRLWALWVVAGGLATAQLAGLIAASERLWEHFDLTTDFALYHQAWSLIGAGHLDPYSTIYPYHYPHYGYPFWANHGELALWALALLHLVWHSSLVLLVVQDLAVVGIGLATLAWTHEVLLERWPTRRRLAGAGALVAFGAMVANPYLYEAALYDFHLQPIATLLLVLAGRDVWAGRTGRSVAWSLLALCCGVPIAAYLPALGLAGILGGRRSRPAGLVVAGVGICWAVVASGLGADVGSHLAANYAYLVGASPSARLSLLGLVGGIFSAPHEAAAVLGSRAAALYRYLASAGVVGVASAWGLFVPAAVLLSTALSSNAAFISPPIGFQGLPALPFLVVGGAMALASLARRLGRLGRSGALGTGALGAAALAQVALVAAAWLPTLGPGWFALPSPTAAVLARVRSETPGAAEVVASQGVIGRFGGRRLAYPELYSNQVVPVGARVVVFVIVPAAGHEAVPASVALGAVYHLQGLPGIRPIAQRSGVYAYSWTPPPGTTRVSLP